MSLHTLLAIGMESLQRPSRHLYAPSWPALVSSTFLLHLRHLLLPCQLEAHFPRRGVTRDDDWLRQCTAGRKPGGLCRGDPIVHDRTANPCAVLAVFAVVFLCVLHMHVCKTPRHFEPRRTLRWQPCRKMQTVARLKMAASYTPKEFSV